MRHGFAAIVITASLLAGCNLATQSENDFNALLNAYGEVWNTGFFNGLDTLVAENFDFRYNSSGPFTGIKPLISGIESTRDPFTDFSLILKEKWEVCDTVCLINWEISGNRKTDNEPFYNKGFSVIFHSDGIITGEWISYSEIDWITGLGYNIAPPK